MQARDGLLVRLRMTGGIVPATTAQTLATLALRYGNGLFDLSARGNLQLRGVTEHTLFPLQNALRDLDVIDADVVEEAVRNVIASPLAGLHEGFDVRPITRALEAHLIAATHLHALPGKFGFLIDDGGTPSLASVGADIRFEWDDRSSTFLIGLGGTARDSLWIGRCAADELVGQAERVALGALSLFSRSRTARRMRALIHEFGPDTVASACLDSPEIIPKPAPPSDVSDVSDAIVGMRSFSGRSVLGLATPFGRLDHRMLSVVSDLAAHTSGAEIRLTPWRTLLVPDAVPTRSKIDLLQTIGFIFDSTDARLSVAACVGREGCSSGTTSTQTDALSLADLAARIATGNKPVLHVSGCQKGCARAATSAVTLVGRDGRYDLVQDGRASDFPVKRGLDMAALRTEIEAMLVKA